MRASLKAAWLAGMACAMTGGMTFAQGTWKPERNIEIIVGSTPGTGTDRTARLIQKIWPEQKALPVTSTGVNTPGVGRAVARAYPGPKAGDAHFLQVTSYNLVTNHITGRSTQNYTDFTPISLLLSEYIGFAVKADSPYKTLADLAKALRENPESVPIGTSRSAGGANHRSMAGAPPCALSTAPPRQQGPGQAGGPRKHRPTGRRTKGSDKKRRGGKTSQKTATRGKWGAEWPVVFSTSGKSGFR